METVDVKIKIYCLKHPISNEIRYIGVTSKSLKFRLRKHIDNAKYGKHNKHLCNWILSILKEEEKPLIEQLDEVDLNDWQNQERLYIAKYRSPRLLNMNEGGEGNCGLKHSEETKLKISKKKRGLRPTAETLLKRSKALKNRVLSIEHREKISKAHQGKIHTKYNILVKDIINNVEITCYSVKEVAKKFNMGEMTVRRNLNKKTLIKKRFILTKI